MSAHTDPKQDWLIWCADCDVSFSGRMETTEVEGMARYHEVVHGHRMAYQQAELPERRR